MNQASTFLARFLFLLLIIGIGISDIFGNESAEAYPVVVLESSFGLMFGTATQEVIFQDYKLSELDWSSIPLFYFGSSLELRFPTGLISRFGVAYALSGHSGSMTDSDWKNYDNVLTNFSSSESWTEKAYILSIELTYDFALSETLVIEPLISVGYQEFGWTSRGGSYWYPVEVFPPLPDGTITTGPVTPISSNTPFANLHTTGIIYEQRSIYLGFGFSLIWRPSASLEFETSLSATPLVTMESKDEHTFRKLVFAGTLGGGLVLRPEFRFEYRVSDSLGINLDLEYLGLQGLAGGIGVSDDQGNFLGAEDAKDSFAALKSQVSLRVRL